MKLIDADKLHLEAVPMDMGGLVFIEDVLERIYDMPAADAVEVVRCRECNWAINNGEKWLHCMTNRDVNGDARAVSEHGFCSYGERKENT